MKTEITTPSVLQEIENFVRKTDTQNEKFSTIGCQRFAIYLCDQYLVNYDSQHTGINMSGVIIGRNVIGEIISSKTEPKDIIVKCEYDGIKYPCVLITTPLKQFKSFIPGQLIQFDLIEHKHYHECINIKLVDDTNNHENVQTSNIVEKEDEVDEDIVENFDTLSTCTDITENINGQRVPFRVITTLPSNPHIGKTIRQINRNSQRTNTTMTIVDNDLIDQQLCKISSIDIFSAVTMGDVETVLWLLNHYPHLSSVRDVWSRTPLHYMCRQGYTIMIQSLLSIQMCNVNAMDSNGIIPLREAVEFNQLDCVHLLLQRNADPNIKDKNGRTCYHLAAMKGYCDILELILPYCKDINVKDLENTTSLYKATYYEMYDAVKLLINWGASIEKSSIRNHTIAQMLAKQKQYDLLKLVFLARIHTTNESWLNENTTSTSFSMRSPLTIVKIDDDKLIQWLLKQQTQIPSLLLCCIRKIRFNLAGRQRQQSIEKNINEHLIMLSKNLKDNLLLKNLVEK
ncbi:unnamed protein product [Didymodactylos carnosus]|uniref:Uncharacterized protein n=1 Tax=Didymodactylos carnosus TaxID=1234261 RepID=A0A814X6Q2_9BILA|nr:unnamed protein product [Didymodactylos carnosus]CAF3975701.1 unnamed protein product [Didymodactylos carnosus]